MMTSGFIGPQGGPGAQGQPMQHRAAGEPVSAEPKIFAGQIPIEATQNDVFALFSRYGTVKTCVIITGPDGRSKGCAKVLYERWAEAEAAVEAENGSCNLGGSKPMVVKFADPPKRGGPDGSSGGIAPKKLFVGQVPANTTEAELRTLFAPYGTIVELHLLKKNQGAGCAFVTYERWSMCEAAIEAHNGKTQLEGAKAPMVVKFADAGTSVPGGQKRPYGDLNGFPGMQMAMGAQMAGMPGTLGGPKKQFTGFGYPPYGMGGMGYGGMAGMMGPGMMGGMMGMNMPGMAGPTSRTPSNAGAGAGGQMAGSMTSNRLGTGIVDESARAWKLFVGQVPFEAHERDLWPVFSALGPILELVILRSGGKSRGCAFVTYENRMLAEKAIRQLDGQAYIPSDPRQRLLIVKYANSGAAMAAGAGALGASTSGADAGGAMAMQQQQQMAMQQQMQQYQQQYQLGGAQQLGASGQGQVDMSAAAAYGAQPMQMGYSGYSGNAGGMYGQQF